MNHSDFSTRPLVAHQLHSALHCNAETFSAKKQHLPSCCERVMRSRAFYRVRRLYCGEPVHIHTAGERSRVEQYIRLTFVESRSVEGPAHFLSEYVKNCECHDGRARQGEADRGRWVERIWIVLLQRIFVRQR